MFYPKSVAIIGASTTKNSVGNDIFTNVLLSFSGPIFPVNPKYSHIDNLPCFSSVLDIPEMVDLAIIAIPADFVEKTILQCGQKGIQNIVLISAGFSEIGQVEREQKIVEICKKYGMNLLGPNCLGFVRAGSINASFAEAKLDGGNVAFISQSGAMGTALMDAAVQYGIGLNTFVSIGNKALLGEIELLKFFEKDEKTSVIALYLESTETAKKWLNVMKNITKPVIILKSGRTDFGVAASSSHTAALATNDVLFSSLCKQMGVIRAQNIQQLFDYCQSFSVQPKMVQNRVAIVTNAGGPGVISADSVFECGLKLSEIEPKLQQEIATHLPNFAHVSNPVDLLGDADETRFSSTLDSLLKSTHVDAIQVIVTPQKSTPVQKIVDEIIAKKPFLKPVTVCLLGGSMMHNRSKKLNQNGIDVTEFPEYGINNLAALHTWQNWQKNDQKNQPLHADTSTEKMSDNTQNLDAKNERKIAKGVLLEPDIFRLFSQYNLPLPMWHFADIKNLDELTKIETNKHWAVKIVSPDILHKTDVGGVELNVQSRDVFEVAQTILQRVLKRTDGAKIAGILCTEMQPKSNSVEMILGLKFDASLGCAIMLGAGGTSVEIWNDTAFLFPPFSQNQAKIALESLTSFPLLNGFRGGNKKYIDGILKVAMTLQKIQQNHPEIIELDINPLLVFDEKVVIVDAKIIAK